VLLCELLPNDGLLGLLEECMVQSGLSCPEGGLRLLIVVIADGTTLLILKGHYGITDELELRIIWDGSGRVVPRDVKRALLIIAF